MFRGKYLFRAVVGAVVALVIVIARAIW